MRWTWTHVAVPPPACGLFYSALDCTLSPKCSPDIKRRLDAWPVRRGGTAKKELENDTASMLVNPTDWGTRLLNSDCRTIRIAYLLNSGIPVDREYRVAPSV